MIHLGEKIEYNIRQKKDLVTTVGSDPSKYMMDFLNELGEQGEFVIGTPQESGEPSAITAATGQKIPYYVLTVLTATKKKEKKEETE